MKSPGITGSDSVQYCPELEPLRTDCLATSHRDIVRETGLSGPTVNSALKAMKGVPELVELARELERKAAA